jgi:hypothetical protein
MSNREEVISNLFMVGKLYIALEGGPRFNFEWQPGQVRGVISAWEAGVSAYDIAREHDRDPDEVAVLIMDLRRRRVIKNRPGGLWGKGKAA